MNRQTLSPSFLTKVLALAFGLASLVLWPSGGSLAAQDVVDTIFAIDSSDNSLVRFTSANPGRVISLGRTLSFVGIDFRPADGRLYGLTDGANPQVYALSTTGGNPVSVGNPLSVQLDGDSFGFDFNPVPDRIRVNSDNDQNLRLNPNDGALAATDGKLAYNMMIGGKANVVAAAYTNSFGPSPRQTPGTTLFGIDSLRDALVVQDPPNAGVLSVVGLLGVDVDARTTFDIVGLDNTAYATFVLPGRNTSTLFSINLMTGQASAIGEIGARGPVTAMAVAPRQ